MEISLPVPDVIGRLERRVYTEFAREAEEWSLYLNALSRWEDEHLLDNPTPELLAEHKKAIEHLLKLGRFFELVTELPDFPDFDTARMVAATQQTLRDMLQMRHGERLGKDRADAILAQAFPDEP